MKKWFLLFSAGVLSIASNAQARKINFEKYTLTNGLTVILHRDTTAPVVAVTTLYHVGSKNEDTARTGFAHFFEHLLFEGSDNIKRGEFDKYVTNAGGALNANTSQDRTFYYELLPSNQLKLGLWLESERMMHAKIEQVGVNTQREVVKEEKRQRMDNQPYGSFLVEMLKRAFKEHPYRWAPIGSMEHLNAAKLDEFIDFYKTFYVPNNAVLSIAGDINIADTKKLVEDYFVAIPKGTKAIPRPTVTEPPLGGEVRATIEDNIQLPAVIAAYRAPKQGSDEYYAFRLLSTILSGGPSSRMNKILVDQKQMALQAAAIPFFNEDAGLFISLAIANMGVKPEALESAIDSVVSDLKTKPVSESEFQKVKNQIETQFVSSNATMAGIAESLANYEVYFGDANLINTELARYQKVTREDLLNVAKKYLNKDNRVVLYYVPKGKKEGAM
ncbi:M16 family metallopeptidase [Flavisolibacter nicotianae]|uniref:M16 family metallopeptidase n=1 Tax=Flavisolibacter nicotianae TaxID=2364882 RepID=UPI000EB2252C|nr:pitrilysin family protein [Flavisolibacter nicotianae]